MDQVVTADDSILVVSGKNAKEMEEKFCLTVQPSKTEIIHLNLDGPSINVMGENITPKKSIKFLGVIVQKNFKWHEHVDKI